MISAMEVLVYAIGTVSVVSVSVFIMLCRMLNKPPPSGGSAYTLPNGLVIQHWQKDESDFLYREIFGAESAYSRGGLIFRPGALIIDAGANIGMFSLFAAGACKGAARILSFEPIPSTFVVLAANARAASAGEYAAVLGAVKGQSALSIEAINVGLSDATAHVTFQHHPHFSVWSTSDAVFAEARLTRIADDMPRALATSDSWFLRNCFPSALARLLAKIVLRGKVGKMESVPVKLERLSDVIDGRSVGPIIDFLKIDVEGAELKVMAGLRDDHWAMVQQCALEVENFANRDVVLAILKGHGFETDYFASERERNPGVESEVSMVYGIRPA